MSTRSMVVSMRNYRAIKDYSHHKIHNLFKYPAKLIPEIPHAFLSDEADKKKIILDPFCGSGTVMIESQRLGFQSIGIDINPLSTFITKVKTTPLPWDKIDEYCESFAVIAPEMNYSIPSFTNKDYWFKPNIEQALGKIRSWLQEIKQEHKNKDLYDFFAFGFAGLIRKYSSADNHIFPPVKKKEKEQALEKITEQEIFPEYLKKVKYNAKIMKEYFSKIEDQNEKIPEVKTITASASSPLLLKESVDYIITSPPYINAQKYLRTTKFELFWLDFLDPNDLAELDRKFIGTERIYKEDYSLLDTIEDYPWSKTIKQLQAIDKYRAVIAHKYFLEMQQAFKHFHSYLKDNGRFILVIGNNTIRGQKIRNNEILAAIAETQGFELQEQHRDKIKRRSLPRQRNKTADVMDYEYILEFTR